MSVVAVAILGVVALIATGWSFRALAGFMRRRYRGRRQ